MRVCPNCGNNLEVFYEGGPAGSAKYGCSTCFIVFEEEQILVTTEKLKNIIEGVVHYQRYKDFWTGIKT